MELRRRWRNFSEMVPEFVEDFLSENFEREPLLLEVERVARERKIPILLPSAASFLRLLCRLISPERILEVGTGIGYSTLNMLFALGGNCKVITADTNLERLKMAREFFRKAGFNVESIYLDGFSLMRKFLSNGRKFDLIFVDSVKAEYPFFNYKVQALLSENGVAVFDNVLFRGYICRDEFPERYRRTVSLLKEFVRGVKSYPNFDSFIVPVGDGLLVLKQASRCL